MPKYPCPVCGDPNAFPIWLDANPPDRGPEDYTHDKGVTRAGDCTIHRTRAVAESIRRRCAPDCFDEAGALLPGKLAAVFTRTEAAGYDPTTGIPRLTAEEWNSYTARHGLLTGEAADAATMRAFARPVDGDHDGEL